MKTSSGEDKSYVHSTIGIRKNKRIIFLKLGI